MQHHLGLPAIPRISCILKKGGTAPCRCSAFTIPSNVCLWSEAEFAFALRDVCDRLFSFRMSLRNESAKVRGAIFPDLGL